MFGKSKALSEALSRVALLSSLRDLAISERDMLRSKCRQLQDEVAKLQREADRRRRVAPTPPEQPGAPDIELVQDGEQALVYLRGVKVGSARSVDHEGRPGEPPVTTLRLYGTFLSRRAAELPAPAWGAPCAWKGMAGWIDWPGGECPVNGAQNVEVRFRNGEVVLGGAPASTWRWQHSHVGGGGREHDIVAYRVRTP